MQSTMEESTLIKDAEQENQDLQDDDEKQTFKQKLKSEFKIDRTTIAYKAFYFFFFGGFGSSFPYMPLYFRQIGLNASLVGLLAGIRPLIQFASAPFWSVLSDKFKARKAVLLFSITAWLVMTLALLIPKPHNTVCKVKTNIVIRTGMTGGAADFPEAEAEFMQNHSSKFLNIPKQKMESFIKSRTTKSYQLAQSLDKAVIPRKSLQNTDKQALKQRRSSGNTTASQHYQIVRDPHEINMVFIWLMVLIVVGEFLEAPTFILADTALLQKLQERKKHYGKTRLFGSLGYATASFIVGALLETTRYTYCGQSMNDYNYLFYIFAVVMGLAFIFAAFLFEFNYDDDKNGGKIDECAVWKVLLDPKYSLFMTIAWFLGFSNGLLFNFLNWYLEDLGASKLLMGSATFMRATGLVIAFFLNSFMTDRCGHVFVSFMSISSYFVLFISLATMRNPLWAFPLELLEGLAYGTSWSTCVTYMAGATPMSGAATMQGILQGIYWGLGGGLGAILGGVMIDQYGAVLSFFFGALLSLVFLFVFLMIYVLVNRNEKKKKEWTPIDMKES
ncbi:major facilitator superfamily domain-containing protein 6-like [Actinia tenebrosa]|uniref:Major facilitator superfamily domain-containing protein 6-like n=1 Tax=Actinia tenebrosa TaxID=6105 RepID=A0A6P8IJ22_ACTTE|nr:major facilitator superfamily domain-containing protein 6-like [Actinia tenebrosa]